MKNISVKIITLSDRAYQGKYEDKSGSLIEEMLTAFFKENGIEAKMDKNLIPDEAEMLTESVLNAVGQNTDLIFTTGGTGISPRDITPDVIKPLLDKEIPGIMEFIRVKYGMKFPNAILSRGIAGVANNTIIYTLPGSVKAVKEYLDEIIPTLLHSLKMLQGEGH